MFMKLDEQKIITDISPPEGFSDNANMLVKQINFSIVILKKRENSNRFHYNEVYKKIPTMMSTE